MNLKYLIPLPLSVIIWSGYVLVDMFVYFPNSIHGLLPIIGIPIFSFLTLAIWNGWFEDDEEE